MRFQSKGLLRCCVALAALLLTALPVSAAGFGAQAFWLPPGFGLPWMPPAGPWYPAPGPSTPKPTPAPGYPAPAPGRVPDGFPQGFQVPLSRETGRPVGGWACDPTHRTAGGAVSHTPVLFVHGATRDAHDWDAIRQQYRQAGYSDCELWAVSYGYDNPQRPDTNAASAPTVQAFARNMLTYIQRYKNPNIKQIDVVAHSLGGTVVRSWLRDSGDYATVRSFISIASPHHGLGGCYGNTTGVCGELTPGSAWLTGLNAGTEVPGRIRYMTIYDGTGRFDPFYPQSLVGSPALKGAVNHPYNVEHGTGLDHLAMAGGTVQLQLNWLQAKAPASHS